MYRLGPMLPFDTLLIPVSLQDRLLVAHGASLYILSSAASLPVTTEGAQRNEETDTSNRAVDSNSSSRSRKRVLRVGFMSYDFNDHPTAHLVEGIFDIAYRRRTQDSYNYIQKVELIIFSYGKNDGSSYRIQLEQVSYFHYFTIFVCVSYCMYLITSVSLYTLHLLTACFAFVDL